MVGDQNVPGVLAVSIGLGFDIRYDTLQTLIYSVGNLKVIILATDRCFVLADITVMHFPLVTQQEKEQLMLLK
jgi:hypothetical protein